MGKPKRKARPSPAEWYWWDSDFCWRCKNKNNCNQCKILKVQKIQEQERRERKLDQKLKELY